MKAGSIEFEFQNPLLGTRADYEELKQSVVWRDIRNFMKERIEDLQMKLENAQTIEDVREYQAALRNSRDFLELPDMFMMELENLKPIEPNEEEPDHE